jgi:hypothetical protein
MAGGIVVGIVSCLSIALVLVAAGGKGCAVKNQTKDGRGHHEKDYMSKHGQSPECEPSGLESPLSWRPCATMFQRFAGHNQRPTGNISP